QRCEAFEGPRGHTVLQARQDLDVLRGQDVGPRSQELADLDGQSLEARREIEGGLRTPAMMASVPALLVRSAPALDQLVARVDACEERRQGCEASSADEHRRILRSGAARCNALHSAAPPGKLRRR